MGTNENVNVQAMYRAQVLLFGEDVTMIIAKLADTIDQAMRDGYDLGRIDAEANVEDRLDQAFDEGFEQGTAFQELEDEEDAEQSREECFDDGYLEGVEDARLMSTYADSRVQSILNKRAGQSEEFNFDLVRDSGDETDERLIDEA